MAVILWSVAVVLFTCSITADALSIQPPPLDCGTVFCKAVICEENEQSVIPGGQCCPICRPKGDCYGAICPLVRCSLNYVSVIPEGECCPTCQIVDKCLGILCALPLCAGNSRPIVPEGECCPKCLPDCSALLCVRPKCRPGEALVVPDGECCPRCQLDCSVVGCLRPVCRSGEILVTPEGGCCPICQLDCTLVDCALPVCSTGERAVVPEGQCCPICVPDPSCAAVSCLIPVCPVGQVAEVPDGECCPICVPDSKLCDAVRCLNPVCPAGQVAKVPDGECCPVCTCAIEGQTFSECASACPRTCDLPGVFCLAPCRPGCHCSENQVIDTMNNRCVPAEECPNPCPIKGQIRSKCAGCDTTCTQFINQELILCPAVCRVGGCTCSAGQVVDTMNNECSTPDECPNPCEIKKCAHGSRCKIFEPTGEVFCEPSCSFDNGGCSQDQSCSLQVVTCFRAPCPPAVQCTGVCALPVQPGPCRGSFPRFFHNPGTGQCEAFTYGGCEGNSNNFMSLEQCEDKCVDICALPVQPGPCKGSFPRFFHNPGTGQCEAFTYGGCGGNSNHFKTLNECENKCEDPCDARNCSRGSSCQIYEPTGEAFCEPSCSIDNGGCLPNQTCSLKVVQCVRAPCPALTECTDQDTCALPAETGPCEALIPRFFHNDETNQCESFIYGGCDGNANNFETLEECESRCNVSSSPCDALLCPNGFRCEVFNNEEAFCAPDCCLNNGGCLANETCRLEDVLCVRAPCPPNRICEPTCPPTCSKDFCRKHPHEPCSNPGPRELPGCTGQCQFSYCKACYVAEDPISPPPGSCTLCNLADYTSNTECYRDWARCTGHAHKKRFGRPDLTSEEEFRCYTPPCPLRG